VALQVPRDRDGSVAPTVVPPHQTTMVGIEDQVVALYARGMSTRDIQAQLADLYGVAISPALVSNITDKLLPRITEWQQRPLAACYPVVFRDAIHYKVREDGRVVTKAAYMVVGIDLAGYKDVLGM
jgi:putative transposase